MKDISVIVFCLALLFSACVPKSTPAPAVKTPAVLETVADVSFNPNTSNRTGNSVCNDYESYIPYPDREDFFERRTLRVNFHLMYDSLGESNIPKETARKRIEDIVYYSNVKWGDNCRMKLPQNNDTPALPTKIRLQLTPHPDIPGDTGIYFHDDQALFPYVKRGKNENRGKIEVIKKYGVQLDTVLNIFIMPHHPDSLKSRKYKADVTGIALLSRSAIKIAGFHANASTPAWELAKTVNHEVGHMLTLNHSWRKKDGCPDTPPHPNCWHYTKNGSECDSLISNNLMDYNSGTCALTPCQIGRMHKVLSRETFRQRKWLVPVFCRYDARKDVTVTDSIHLTGSKDMHGDLIVAAGGVLKISCRISLPEGGKISVLPGGKLILDDNKLHNACGYEWEGVRILTESGRKGEVEMQGNPVFENVAGESITEVSLD